jgi:hypothetical protein
MAQYASAPQAVKAQPRQRRQAMVAKTRAHTVAAKDAETVVPANSRMPHIESVGGKEAALRPKVAPRK